ncbi:hypothetical protein cand_008950 [Cryptosporidium andersoni]|uniref:Uncharacterized protein n=1 Tax=Cryptosporidium andersoni TaxID=117008 RepID=A0A1J4MWH9_9CRYT|nr:hypothetical protein cand_008950 [Cryptosporidium andersoni]
MPILNKRPFLQKLESNNILGSRSKNRVTKQNQKKKLRSYEVVWSNAKLIWRVLLFLELKDLVYIRTVNPICEVVVGYIIKDYLQKDKLLFRSHLNISTMESYNIIDSNYKDELKLDHIFDSSRFSLLRTKFIEIWNICSNIQIAENLNQNDNRIKILVEAIYILVGALGIHPKYNTIIDIENFFGEIRFNNNYNTQGFAWKQMARLSGYNLSSAEILRENGKEVDYFYWPEKVDDPKYSSVDVFTAQVVLEKIAQISELDEKVYKQLRFLIKKHLPAELTFYNSSGVAIEKTILYTDDKNEPKEFESKESMQTKLPVANMQLFSDSKASINLYNNYLINSFVEWIIVVIKTQNLLPHLKQIGTSTLQDASLLYDSLYLSRNAKTKINSDHTEPSVTDINTVEDCNLNSRNSKNALVGSQETCIGSEHVKVCNSKYMKRDKQTAFKTSEHLPYPMTVEKLCKAIKNQEVLLRELKTILKIMRSHTKFY